MLVIYACSPMTEDANNAVDKEVGYHHPLMRRGGGGEEEALHCYFFTEATTPLPPAPPPPLDLLPLPLFKCKTRAEGRQHSPRSCWLRMHDRNSSIYRYNE